MTAPTSAAELTTAEMAAVMIAASEGKPIQAADWLGELGDERTLSPYYDCRFPTWNWLDCRYRVKPEEAVPRTIRFCTNERGKICELVGPLFNANEQGLTFTELPPGWEVRRKD